MVGTWPSGPGLARVPGIQENSCEFRVLGSMLWVFGKLGGTITAGCTFEARVAELADALDSGSSE